MQLFSNNGSSTLASGITDTATSVTVATGEGALFTSPTGDDYEILTLDDGTNIEIIKLTSRIGDVLTIEREQESTTKVAFSAGTVIEGRVTAQTLEKFGNSTSFIDGGDPSTDFSPGDETFDAGGVI